MDAPTRGTLEVLVATTGSDTDTDGYTLTLAGRPSAQVPSNGGTTFVDLPSGSHLLELTGVSTNCGVSGQNPRSVTVPDGATATASISVVCSRVDYIAITSARAGGQSIWAVAPDGSHPTRLTTGGIDIDFVWSPDGARFAYVSQRGAVDELWIAAWDGSSATRIFQGSPVRSPDWSPDGTRLVFLASVDSGPHDLWVIHADGREATNLTNDDEAGNYSDARWSPDGIRLLVGSSRPGSQQRDVWTLNADGSDLTNLTNAPGADRMARWSPTGDRIAYLREVAEDELWVMGADGTDPRRFTGPVDASPPAWSPDGTTLAFVREHDVWVVSADGLDAVNLTGGMFSTLYNEPVWSPDGSRIAFVAGRLGDSGADIWAIDPDGANPAQLTDVSGWNGHPRWRPE